jgi:hypothetical protein
MWYNNSMNMMSRLAERVSALSVNRAGLLTPIGRFVLGTNQELMPVQWRLSLTKPHEVPNWAEFEGDPSATTLPWPRLYRVAGTIGINAEMLKAAEARAGSDARPALAWRFDEETVLTAILSAERLVPDELFVRIGGGDTAFSVGFESQAGTLYVAPGTVTAGEVSPLAASHMKGKCFY